MGHAVQLYFNTELEATLVGVRAALTMAGITPTLERLGDRPHISLAVLNGADVGRCTPMLERFSKTQTSFAVNIAAFGAFPTTQGVVYLTMHEQLKDIGARIHEHYSPDDWVPHVTIGFELPSQEVTLALSWLHANFKPVFGKFSSIGLIEFRPVTELATFELSGENSIQPSEAENPRMPAQHMPLVTGNHGQEIPVLKTERLLLRPFTLADAAEVKQLAGEFEIADTTQNIPHPYEDGMAEQWIGGHQEDFNCGKGVTFAIAGRDDGRVLGAIALMKIESGHQAELGYWIGKPFWNRGFCTEAGTEFLRYAFVDLALVRVHVNHLSRNPASGRVIRKLGFSHEGSGKQHVSKWGRFEDVELYGILKQHWLNNS